MRVLDLFSGIGGFALGLERAGRRSAFVQKYGKSLTDNQLNEWAAM